MSVAPPPKSFGPEQPFAKTRTAAIYHEPDALAGIVDENGFLDGEVVLVGLRFRLADLFRNVPRG
jgi:hypothetical protein